MYFQVTHLLPENHEKNASDDYILLHPGAAQYIWFPDVYIGKEIYHIVFVIFDDINYAVKHES